MLSRVLIKGERFGRAAWQDREARLRQQMLGVFADGDKGQVAAAAGGEQRGRADVKIVAIDLQPISPLAGITTLRADITHPATVPLLLSALDPGGYSADAGAGRAPADDSARHRVDLVLSDGAPDVTGLHDLDIYVQSQLLFAALNLALCVLKPGGKFVAKIFRGRNVDVLYAQLSIFFERVVVAKPRSSRASSVEAFIVCLDFRPPAGFRASLEEPLGVGQRLEHVAGERKRQLPVVAGTVMQNPSTGAWDCEPVSTPGLGRGQEITEIDLYDETLEDNHVGTRAKGARWIAPFIACGDLSAFDSDASYQLPKDYVSLDPVQPPIAPPYKRAIEMRAAQSKVVK